MDPTFQALHTLEGTTGEEVKMFVGPLSGPAKVGQEKNTFSSPPTLRPDRRKDGRCAVGVLDDHKRGSGSKTLALVSLDVGDKKGLKIASS